MKPYILDASALVKAYHEEPGHDFVRGLIDSHQHCSVLSVSLAEVFYVLAKLCYDRKEILPDELAQYNAEIARDIADERVKVRGTGGDLALEILRLEIARKAWCLPNMKRDDRPNAVDCLVAAFASESEQTGAAVVSADGNLNTLLRDMGLSVEEPC